jgi:hypothetical protein
MQNRPGIGAVFVWGKLNVVFYQKYTMIYKMPLTELGLIRAKKIGTFEQSNEFLSAPADTLQEMRDAYTEWKQDVNNKD